MKQKALLLTSLFIMTSTFNFALCEEKSKELTFEYPELMVVPKASARLDMEAKAERKDRWTNLMPMQISAVSTILAGLVQLKDVDGNKDPDRYSPWAGIAVGSAWLGTTLWLNHSYSIFNRADSLIEKLPEGTKREQLTKERLAEENLERIHSLGNKMRWTSFVTNAAVSGYMVGKAKKDSLAILTGVVAIISSSLPVIFDHSWVTPYNEQQKYKKKIYAPIVMAGPMISPQMTFAPGVNLNWIF